MSRVFFMFSFKWNQNDEVLIIVTLKMEKKKKAVMKVRTMDETLKTCMALVLTTKATNILVVH